MLYKKTFIKIAALLRSAQEQKDQLMAASILDRVTDGLADILAETNSKFDRARFLKAAREER